MQGPKVSIIRSILAEAKSYSSLEAIEQMIQSGANLSSVPVSPLYMLMRPLEAGEMALYLERLSAEQRQIFLDFDLWQKDELDPEEGDYWIQSYARCPSEEIRQEFVQSYNFLFLLKGKCNIWTFDVEDPQYPDHDYYFLTDDQLLLIEYGPHFPFPRELQLLVRDLYGQMGVEEAYNFLLKTTVDSYLLLQEELYQDKKTRLAEIGHMDYYSALELYSDFKSQGEIQAFLRKKRSTAVIADEGKGQSLSFVASGGLEDKEIESLDVALTFVDNEKRNEYLRFNFLRLFNGVLALEQSAKEGRLACSRVNKQILFFLKFGKIYIEQSLLSEKPQELMKNYDFIDLFRVGRSLIKIQQRKLKRAMTAFNANDEQAFLGRFFNEFLDDALADIPKHTISIDGPAKEIVTLEEYDSWQRDIDFLVELLPLGMEYFKAFQDIKQKGLLQDNFYRNYNVEDIDLEAILLSSLAISALGIEENSEAPKLGLTQEEYLKFIKLALSGKEQKATKKNCLPFIEEYLKEKKLDKMNGLKDYLFLLLKEHLEGPDYSSLSDDDFVHVGGPIILEGRPSLK